MKENYEIPVMEVMVLEEDIITTSNSDVWDGIIVEPEE